MKVDSCKLVQQLSAGVTQGSMNVQKIVESSSGILSEAIWSELRVKKVRDPADALAVGWK
jgi:hypothetical protein